ncbi:hypothetical protein ACFQV2_20025 [Actinokineospora soli]|uniref:Uncharacterized protein n=1 Tax=Actinokineospora soli TaxID=1048753 RepID=A0ABW2TQC8_9PSEU
MATSHPADGANGVALGDPLPSSSIPAPWSPLRAAVDAWSGVRACIACPLTATDSTTGSGTDGPPPCAAAGIGVAVCASEAAKTTPNPTATPRADRALLAPRTSPPSKAPLVMSRAREPARRRAINRTRAPRPATRLLDRACIPAAPRFRGGGAGK